jgi:uncharacterized paraquat-inducible protein A
MSADIARVGSIERATILDSSDTPLAIRCSECGRVASLTPRQLRSSLAAQCRQCKHDLSEIAGAALKAHDEASAT